MQTSRPYRAIIGAAYAHPSNMWMAAFNVVAACLATLLGVIAVASLIGLGWDAWRLQPKIFANLWLVFEWTAGAVIALNWLALLRGLAAMNRRAQALLVPGWPGLQRRLLFAGWALLSVAGALLAGFDGGPVALYAWGIGLGLLMLRPGAGKDGSWNGLAVILWVQILMPQLLDKIDVQLAAIAHVLPLPVALVLMGASFALGLKYGFPPGGRDRAAAADKGKQEATPLPLPQRARQKIEALLPAAGARRTPREIMWRLVARDSLAVLPLAAGLLVMFAVVSLAIAIGLISLERQATFIYIATMAMAALPVFSLAARIGRQFAATRHEQALYSLAPRRCGNEALASLLLRRALGGWLVYILLAFAFLWLWRAHGGTLDPQKNAPFMIALFTAGLLPLAGALKNYASLEQSSTLFNGFMIGLCIAELLVLALFHLAAVRATSLDVKMIDWLAVAINASIVLATCLWRRELMLRAPAPFPAWRMP